MFDKYTNCLQTKKYFTNFFTNFFKMLNQNLIKAVNTLGIEKPVSTLSKNLDFSKGTVSSYLNGNIKASENFLEKFANFYNIDINLLRDISTENNSDITKFTNKKSKNDKLVPFYDIDFAAGNALTLVDNTQVTPDYYMDVPEFSGCTAFRAYSDSMEKLIKLGSILFGTKVDEWQIHLEYGQIYVIICTDGRRYLKYIKKHPEQSSNFFLLKSENDFYDDFDIPKKSIRSIWLIHGWLNKRT